MMYCSDHEEEAGIVYAAVPLDGDRPSSPAIFAPAAAPAASPRAKQRGEATGRAGLRLLRAAFLVSALLFVATELFDVRPSRAAHSLLRGCRRHRGVDGAAFAAADEGDEHASDEWIAGNGSRDGWRAAAAGGEATDVPEGKWVDGEWRAAEETGRYDSYYDAAAADDEMIEGRWGDDDISAEGRWDDDDISAGRWTDKKEDGVIPGLP